jgi:transcriptional regulator with XRE-family HTH domain
VHRGGELIREARLRAGLTQKELSELTGRERSVIARWEQGVISPPIDSLMQIIHACGFDLPLTLMPGGPLRGRSWLAKLPRCSTPTSCSARSRAAT